MKRALHACICPRPPSRQLLLVVLQRVAQLDHARQHRRQLLHMLGALERTDAGVLCCVVRDTSHASFSRTRSSAAARSACSCRYCASPEQNVTTTLQHHHSASIQAPHCRSSAAHAPPNPTHTPAAASRSFPPFRSALHSRIASLHSRAPSPSDTKFQPECAM